MNGRRKTIRSVSKSANCIVCLLFILILMSGAAIAYFTDIQELENVVGIGHVKITPDEKYEPPEEIIPGTVFVKDVKASNSGPVDCYVRMKILFTDGDMENYCEVDFNTKDYVYNEVDGYYYLKEKLEQLDTSPSLITKVKVKEKYDKDGDGSEDVLTEEDMKPFDVMVYMEGFQTIYNDAENKVTREFVDYQEAWEYYDRHRS